MITATAFENKIVGVLRGYNYGDAHFAIDTAMGAGLEVFEIAIRQGYENIDLIMLTALKKAMPYAVIGAGTVIGTELCDKVIKTGADFIVSPVLETGVISRCRSNGVLCIPGTATPTEMYTAYKLGVELVKLFPAACLGSEFLKAVKAPLPQIKIMPFGGIDVSNIAQFRAAGAYAFGVGGAIFSKDDISKRNTSAITEKVKRLYREIL